MCWPHSWNFFNAKRFFSKLWFGTGVFYSELSFFVKSGVDITRAVMVWICLYMFFGEWKRKPLCHPQIFQEDGHFHLPHLPNSSKNHHEISWDHTINMNISSWAFKIQVSYLPKWSKISIFRHPSLKTFVKFFWCDPVESQENVAAQNRKDPSDTVIRSIHTRWAPDPVINEVIIPKNGRK